MSGEIVVSLDKMPAISLPDNYVRPVALPDGGFGLFVGFDSGAVDPLEPDRLYADPAAWSDPALPDVVTLPPWRFHTLEAATEAAASLVAYLRANEARKAAEFQDAPNSRTRRDPTHSRQVAGAVSARPAVDDVGSANVRLRPRRYHRTPVVRHDEGRS